MFKKLALFLGLAAFFACPLWAAEGVKTEVCAPFLGKWEFDYQKTYEKNAKVRQFPADRLERLKKIMAGRKVEIFANGEFSDTFVEFPKESDKMVTDRVKCKILKSTPTELQLEFTLKHGILLLLTGNYISDEYITLFSQWPGDKAEDKIRYYFKKVSKTNAEGK